MRTWNSAARGVAGGEVLSVRMIPNVITVPTLDDVVPDMTWSFVDEHGHEHTFDDAGRVKLAIRVVTDVYWCDLCLDEHDETELRCTECADVVETPKWIHRGPQILTIPGMLEVFIDVMHSDGSVEDVVPCDADEFEWIVGAYEHGTSRSAKLKQVATVLRYLGLLT